jgi:hypothetical protein
LDLLLIRFHCARSRIDFFGNKKSITASYHGIDLSSLRIGTAHRGSFGLGFNFQDSNAFPAGFFLRRGLLDLTYRLENKGLSGSKIDDMSNYQTH